MAPKHTTHTRTSTGVPGVKALITTSALAATLGGWGLFSLTETTQPSESQQAIINNEVVKVQPKLNLPFAPIPTIVPPIPNLEGGMASVAEPSQPPVASQPPAPALLREVAPPPRNAAPAPVTTTRSSR